MLNARIKTDTLLCSANIISRCLKKLKGFSSKDMAV